jgi:hypothetical protein
MNTCFKEVLNTQRFRRALIGARGIIHGMEKRKIKPIGKYPYLLQKEQVFEQMRPNYSTLLRPEK